MKKYNRLFKHSTSAIFIFILFSLFQGCDYFPFKRDPFDGPFPYEFIQIKSLPDTGILEDIDNNGKEEIIHIINVPDYIKDVSPRLHLSDDNFNIVDDINFDGFIQTPYFIDFTNDGIDEIAVPYTRNDTLFLRILKYSKPLKILRDIFLFTGKARIDSTRSYPWTGNIQGMYYLDLDNDLKKELIVYPRETLAQSPRGIIIYDGQSFEKKWEYQTGPFFTQILMDDFNHNGKIEFLIPTSSSCNGNIANDTDDFHSYLYYVEYMGEKAIKIIPFGGEHSEIEAELLDYDNDGTPEIYVLSKFMQSSDQNLKIEVFNLDKNLTKRKNLIWESTSANGQWVFTTDANKNDAILVGTDSGDLLLLDKRLNEIKKRTFHQAVSGLSTCEDLNGDNKDEIILSNNRGRFLINEKLDIYAKLPDGFLISSIEHQVQIYHRKNENSLIALFDNNDEFEYLFALEKKPYYLVSFYGKPAGIVLFFTSLILLVGYSVTNKRQNQYLNRIIDKSFSIYETPLLFINAKATLVFANPPAKILLNMQDSKVPVRLSSLKKEHSEIVQSLHLLNDKQGEQINLNIREKDGTILRLLAEPILERGAKRPDWLVKIENLENKKPLEQAKSWSAMAQRVAHDIKNPLTSIQLTVQRLQWEYQKLESKNAKSYDPYVERILARIDVLKKMSRDFMKFINVEKPNKQLTDMNEFLRNLFPGGSIEIPKDITLNRNFSADLPTIHVDQEQFQTLNENLVSNSINAMPDGGTLTINTSLAPKLRFNQNRPQDFFVLEIMDTGIGISPDMKEKLFQPFTTNSYLGTGLGLAIVKKIVDDHDGHIEVNSEEGVGTSFIIYLPVA